jgi:signal transduction histidine kinase/CheY-like chemotaxis protein
MKSVQQFFLGIFAVIIAGSVYIYLLIPGNVSESPLRIDLRDYPVYMKRGFHPEDLNRGPAESFWEGMMAPGEWKPAIVKNLLPREAEHAADIFLFEEDREYTLLIPFLVNEEQIDLLSHEAAVFPGLFIAGIGDNWEIYLNGVLVLSELYRDEEGQIQQHRIWRDVTAPLDERLFREGENYLGFRIAGPPSHNDTGIFYVSPHFIDDYRIVSEHASKRATLIHSAVYVFVGLYHLLLFFMRRETRYNLYYALFSIAVSIYFITRNNFIYNLFSNSLITTRIENISLYWLTFLLGAFFEEMNLGYIKKFTKIYGGFYLALTFISCLFSSEYVNAALRLWQMSIIVVMAYIIGYDVLYAFIKRVLKIRAEIYHDVKGSTVKAIRYDLLQTPQGNIVVVLSILMVTAVLDILDSLFMHTGIILSQYSLFIFNVFSALILARHLASSYNQANQLNTALEAKVRERTQALEEQVKIAESASRAKSDFMATMSHEIRTPLNAIIGLSDIELRKNQNSDTLDVMKKIRRSGSTLLGIINDILDISKIESGNFEIIPAEYDVAELVSDSVRLNIIRIGEKPIDFALAVDENLPSKLIGDELRLKQILNNLLSNAIKYTQKGKVTLSVFRTGENALSFRVSDTGIGIRKEDMNRLFTEYSQFDTKANRKIEGTGLGLAITKMLLELMDGTIEVESEYGKGSVFTVQIPQQTANAGTLGREKAEKLECLDSFDETNPMEITVSSAMSGIKVLVVDDVEINLEVARGLLEPYGLVVDTVLSGKEAVEKIRAGIPRYDMVLMDHMMPEMDGIEAVRIIRNEIDSGYARDVPVIALTANALAGNEEMFLENGFNGFISKPIDIMRLDEMIRKWIRTGE